MDGGWIDRILCNASQINPYSNYRGRQVCVSADAARNELIVELARALLVLSGLENSASLKLAKSALRRGKFVLTSEHPVNKELLASGALPATLDNLQTALR